MSYFPELTKFIKFANDQTTGSGVDGLKTFNANKLERYQDLKVKVGLGQGRAAHIPYITFLGYNQSTKKGIYPAYLYYKNINILILAYGISETEIPENSWDLENKIKISDLFHQKNWGKPLKYGDSWVYNHYNTAEELNEIQITRDLDEIILKYKLDLDIPIIANNRPIVEINPIIMNDPNLTILTAIKTKPFILLAGISGTGKSRLARTLAYQTCSKEELRVNRQKPGNFELLPVRPNWHDSSELMGYVSRINNEKYISTSFLKFIAKAWRNLDIPFILCLDEMNLAPVEQYFAEYLSIIETRQVQEESIVTDFLISKASLENHSLYSQLIADLELDENIFKDGISIPNNLVVIGTVNMDETTHSFSRKVLDRAMTFEMNEVDLNAGLNASKNDWSYPEKFIELNHVIGSFTSGADVYLKFEESAKEVLKFLENINTTLEGTPFKIAYRVRDEFLIYCYYASLNQTNNWLITALDEMTCMKILSRIEGDEAKTGPVLEKLKRVLSADYKKSYAKLVEMEVKLATSGYTSFWA
jgi:5-methylcytosine-specific restriction protein B